MARPEDQDLTGQDPLSSAAEGDDDPGTAALAVPGEDADGIEGERPDADGPSFAEAGPPPEAADETPLTDVVPDSPGTEPA